MRRKVLQAAALIAVGAVAGYAVAQEDALNPYLPLDAAPVHHKAIIDNQNVRVLAVSIPPAEVVPAHQHTLPSVFITLSPAAALAFRDLAGDRVRDVERGEGLKVEHRDPAPAPSGVQNVNMVELRALRIELKC